MKYVIYFSLIIFTINAQNTDAIKSQIKNSGISKDQAKKILQDKILIMVNI